MANELVLLAVEALGHVVAVEHLDAILVRHLFALLLSLGWLVARKLPQELSRAWHVGVLFVILGGNKQTAQGLQHDLALVHVLLGPKVVHGQEPVQYPDGVVG